MKHAEVQFGTSKFSLRRLLNISSVSEHMDWVRNVVLMNVYSGFGKPQGVGISGGEGPDG